MEIIEVRSKKDFKEFLNLPDKVYTKRPTRYVRPLDVHLKMMIGPLGKPEKHLLMAKENGQIVARLGIKVHRHGNKTPTLNWGFFECVEGKPDAAKALIEKAQSMYPNFKMVGPHHFRMEDPYIGILVEGFEKDPYFLMSYNPPYYDEYLEKAGMKNAMDLFTYELHSAWPLGESIHTNSKRAVEHGVTVRDVNRKKLRDEARIISGIFNDALSENWGYEEFLEEQINEMVTMMKFFLDTRVVTIAEKDGKAVGSLIMIPNYNPLIKSSNGKITPTFLWNFLTQKKTIEQIRGYALGVLKSAHGYGIGSLLVKDMFERCPQYGYPYGELSWVLASNGPMNELSNAMSGKFDKKYRIYEKNPLKHN